MTQDQALPEKAQIGVYEIKAVLSADPFGITYRGWNRHLNAPVALQEYFPAALAARQEDRHTVSPRSESERAAYEAGLASFLEQAQGLMQVEHRNLVRVHNALEANGTGYLIMDHEEGISLTRHCDPPAALTEVALKAILLALLEALQKAHESGVVHGDIHPDNIRIRGDGRAVLIGFATARLATPSSGLPQPKLRAGYAPAEHYDPDYRPGPATDLYALGATMYRCITHAEPVPAPDRVSALGNGKPDPIGFQAGSLSYSEGLLKAIKWLLCPQAKDRPRSASEALAALQPQAEEGQATEQSHGHDETHPPHIVSPAMASSRADPWISAGIAVAALLALSFWYTQLLEQGSETVASNTAPPLLAHQDKSKSSVRPPKKSAKTPIGTKTPPSKEMAINSPLSSKNEPLETSIPDAKGKPVPDSATTPKPETDRTQQSPPRSVAGSQPGRQATTATTVVSEDTIERHLVAAEEDVAALRLTTPAGDNAYQHYQAVLAVAPGHPRALEGMQRIVDQYVRVIRKAVQERRLHRARVYLNRAEAVAPSVPILRSLREELTAAER